MIVERYKVVGISLMLRRCTDVQSKRILRVSFGFCCCLATEFQVGAGSLFSFRSDRQWYLRLDPIAVQLY